MDEGHIETDKLLARLEEEIADVYKTAEYQMQAKLRIFMREYEKELKAIQKQLDDGEISNAEFKAWKREQAIAADWHRRMVQTLAEDATNADFIASSIVHSYFPEAYALNHAYATYQVEKTARISTSYALYSREAVERLIAENPKLLPDPQVDIPKDMAWNEKHLTSAVTQSILQGEGVPQAAARISSVIQMDERAAVRTARTAMTGAQNAGRINAFKRAQGMGIQLKKEWVATLDRRTRHSHRQLDGEVVEVDEEFSNGLVHPGDPYGRPGEVYNCRCTLVAAVDGVDQSDAARMDRLPQGMSYEEWKEQARARMAGQQVGEPDVVRGYVAPDIGTAPVRPRASDFDDPYELDAARSSYRADREAFESRRQELVDEVASQPGHGYGTREEVLAWADRRGVTVTEEVLDAVDSRTMDEIVDVNERLMGKYPEVLQSFESVGGRYVIGLSDDRSVFMEAWGGLKLNPSYFPDYRSAVDHVVDGYTHASYSEQVGRDLAEIVRGDGTFRTSITHEFGHNLDSTIRYGLDTGDVSAYRSDLMDLTRRYTTSEYAMVNDLEAFAEGFAEMECNPTSEYARAFADFLRRWR